MGADVIVVSYNADGAYRKSFSLASSGLSTGYGVAFDTEEYVSLTGGLNLDLDMDPTHLDDIRQGAGQNDIFMARILAQEDTRVSIETAHVLPEGFRTAPPFPNPFTSSVRFSVETDRVERIQIEVFDMLGRSIDRLFDDVLPVGAHTINWSAGGRAAGVYLVHIQGEFHSTTRRVIKLE